jgi:hypothetical protein
LTRVKSARNFLDTTLTRNAAAELLELLRSDYAERPVPRQHGGGQPPERSRFTVEG